MGQPSVVELKERFDNRIAGGGLVEKKTRSTGRALTTDPKIAYEHDPITVMPAARDWRELCRIGSIVSTLSKRMSKASAR